MISLFSTAYLAYLLWALVIYILPDTKGLLALPKFGAHFILSIHLPAMQIMQKLVPLTGDQCIT